MTAQFGFVIVLAVLLSVAGASLALAADPPAADKAPGGAEAEFAALHKEYVAVYQPLWIESSKAWWEANITGSDQAFARKKATDGALVDLHSNKATFARLKALREAGQMRDPENKRLLDVMYRTFLPNQADPELLKRIVDLENDVEQMFNVHRSPVGGKDLTENEVRKILGDSHQSAEAEQAWKGYMAVGAKVDPKLRELVKLRNESARQLGYSNFRALQLAVNEIDDKDLARLFDELDELSRGPFAELKQRIDQTRARWFNVKIEELRPWHYGDLFFQEAPRLQELSLDDLFADQDLLVLARKYYAGIGLPVDDILGRSDLYEKPGKSPHAFCSCIDRVQDIRVLANLQPNRQWADTLLHELGHGVYDKYIAPDVPFVLHEAAHGITTEGVALMLGSMVMQEEWLTKVRGLEAEKAAPAVAAARESQRIEKLVFQMEANSIAFMDILNQPVQK